MKNILKLFTVFVLTTTMVVATVACCCILPAVMAHLHKTVVCSHCATQGSSHGKSSNPAATCLNQLTSVDVIPGGVDTLAKSITPYHPILLVQFLTASLLLSSLLAYPRGSPPLTSSFTPLYLRTFSLRI